MNIEFVDLKKQYFELKEHIDRFMLDTAKDAKFIQGSDVVEFEKNFSKLIGSKHCISCANGTDALTIAMKSYDLSKNDEVLVPAHSWISTSESVTLAGGKPIFVDTEKDTFNISVPDLKKKITKNTVGCVPVHLYGQACEISEIKDICAQNSFWLIEDCAQAHLSRHHGQTVGTFGDISTFSFFPGKNLGAFGDAGCMITNNDHKKDFLTRFSRHGGLYKGEHIIEGTNSRLDNLQAGILNIKMKRIVEWTKIRTSIANLYTENLIDLDEVKTPLVNEYNDHSWHLYVIKTKKRNELKKYLNEMGIPTGIHYPVSLPFLPAYSNLKHSVKEFPNAYENQQQILSLPIHPHLTEDDALYITNSVKTFFNS